MTMVINGTTGVTSGSGQFDSASTFGFKNRIINGAMMIDQRNAGASVTVPNTSVTPTWSLDRYRMYANVASKYSVQQNAGSVTPPAGFTNYLGITSLSSYSAASTDYFLFRQLIEGYNTADLAWGTANASAVTLSFWVRSSLTGTFGGQIINSGSTRNYVFSYTVNSANTWEYKTVVIAGDTSGTWDTTNSAGILVGWDIGSGTSNKGTAGVWGSTSYFGVTGGQSIVGTSGATFYITGVQLEKGSTATSFDYRPYGTELALCQRYYWQINSETSYAGLGSGVMNTANTARIYMAYPVSMRSIPTISGTSFSSMIISQGTDLTPTNMTPYANSKTCMFDMNTSTSGTLGRGAVLLFANLSTGSIQATAEL